MSCSPVRECGRRRSMRSAAPPVRGAASCTTFSPTRRTWFPTWSGSRSTGCCRRSSRHSTTSTRPPISAPGAPTHSARTHLLTIPSAAPSDRWSTNSTAPPMARPVRRSGPGSAAGNRSSPTPSSGWPPTAGCCPAPIPLSWLPVYSPPTRAACCSRTSVAMSHRCNTRWIRHWQPLWGHPQTQAIPVAARLPLQRQLRNALMSRCRNSGSSSSVPILPTVATVLRNCWR